MRIDDAIADGVARRERGPAGGVRGTPSGCTCSGSSPTAACTPRCEHLRALIELGRALAVKDLVVHAFTDGRDTLPHAGAGYLRGARPHAGRARRVGGRALLGDGPRPALGAHAAGLRHARARPRAAPRGQRRAGGAEDAYAGARPTSSSSRRSSARRRAIRPGDSVIAFNFRPDRMRQLTRALAEPGFGEGPRRRARSCPAGAGAAGRRRSRATRRSPSTRRAGPIRSCSRRSTPRRRCRRCSRGPAPRSCTWPRRRSIRT